MNQSLITGSSGFVGTNLCIYLKDHTKMVSLVRNKVDNDLVSESVLYDEFWNNKDWSFKNYIHLAGKAHDLKNISDESEYFKVNYELTKRLYKRFLEDDHAQTFIFISSVKAVADTVEDILDENVTPSPVTAYGRSKLKAEECILDNLPKDKTVIILRPCMIHGPGNKGNLNLLYSIVNKGIPWPLGNFDNQRSFLTIDNLVYVIKEILEGKLESGVYNIADDEPLSTSELVELMAELNGSKPKIWNVPKSVIKVIAKIGNKLPFPLDEERLEKLTENYLVSNEKLKFSLGIKMMPTDSRDGMIKTLKSFN